MHNAPEHFTYKIIYERATKLKYKLLKYKLKYH